MLFKIRKSDVSTHYHNTRTFLNKYRDISWILEVSALNLQKEFKATYELFTDSPLVAGEVKDGGNPPENYTYALVRSKKMMQLTDTAIDLMRRKHKKGEFYYWILYYAYLSPQQCENAGAIFSRSKPRESPFLCAPTMSIGMKLLRFSARFCGATLLRIARKSPNC